MFPNLDEMTDVGEVLERTVNALEQELKSIANDEKYSAASVKMGFCMACFRAAWYTFSNETNDVEELKEFLRFGETVIRGRFTEE